MIRLIRDDQDDVRTLGAMFDGEDRICETLELPWRDNQRGISCIPEGTYHAVLEMSPKRRYKVYWLTDVPGRIAVQIHVGNTTEDIRGCILLGMERHGDALFKSKPAFDMFMRRMGGNNFILTIQKKEA
jgi:hypothetical protein